MYIRNLNLQTFSLFSTQLSLHTKFYTLDSGIDVAHGINVAHGIFGKNIKRTPMFIPECRVDTYFASVLFDFALRERLVKQSFLSQLEINHLTQEPTS
jgi:hypothetical protein